MKVTISLLVFIFALISVFSQDKTLEYNPTRLIVKFNHSSELFKSIRQIRILNYSDTISSGEIYDKGEINIFFNDYRISAIKPAKLSTTSTLLNNEIERIYFFDFQTRTSQTSLRVSLRLLFPFRAYELR